MILSTFPNYVCTSDESHYFFLSTSFDPPTSFKTIIIVIFYHLLLVLRSHNTLLFLRAQDVLNSKMPRAFFASLPIETITHIFDLPDESEPRKPCDLRKHREMCKTLMALRLTCKELEEIATRQLFRTFCLSPFLDSWLKLHTIANSRKFQGHLEILALERQNDPENFLFPESASLRAYGRKNFQNISSFG